MQLVLLSGAAGTGLARELAGRCELTVVAPTTRDSWADGLKRSPDIDAFLSDPAHEPTYGVARALEELAFGAAWQRAHDDEIALRIMRTELLHADFTMTTAVAALAERRKLPFTLLPLSDDRGEMRYVVTDEESGSRAVHHDEYRAALPVGTPLEPAVVALTWSVTEQVVEAVKASEQTTVAVVGADAVLRHAIEAIAARVPEARFVDVSEAGVAEVLRAVTTPR
ncbi:2-phospho-L-lactate transferase CofD family protein [Aeromicrobium sp. Leaf350]|uniref:2-phospho-L-lactate transferase CofD family protein n=1 Tax=Aeromicrobium sp. Leaf350 TaxID=2876565 RepID=UPI001E3A00AA|nr:2-phospho-L-lactate transferase CofD family protein [Aeromicrobium sp. Leaf350]